MPRHEQTFAMSEIGPIISPADLATAYERLHIAKWTCQVCGRGEFSVRDRPYLLAAVESNTGPYPPTVQLIVATCATCGRAELFDNAVLKIRLTRSD